MKNLDIALEFLNRFCAGDVPGLVPLLADDLRFRGPLHRSDSSASYLESLRASQPETARCHVLSLTGDADSVSVYYDYRKKYATITIAQLFRLRERRISEILLVFDTQGVR